MEEKILMFLAVLYAVVAAVQLLEVVLGMQVGNIVGVVSRPQKDHTAVSDRAGKANSAETDCGY